jgi:hypothetical protein
LTPFVPKSEAASAAAAAAAAVVATTTATRATAALEAVARPPPQPFVAGGSTAPTAAVQAATAASFEAPPVRPPLGSFAASSAAFAAEAPLQTANPERTSGKRRADGSDTETVFRAAGGTYLGWVWMAVMGGTILASAYQNGAAFGLQ